MAGRECYAGVSHLHFFQNNGPDKELTELGSRAFVEYLASFEGSVDPGIRIIDMPSVIGKYNKYMGGIDKMDSMIENVLLSMI